MHGEKSPDNLRIRITNCSQRQNDVKSVSQHGHRCWAIAGGAILSVEQNKNFVQLKTRVFRKNSLFGRNFIESFFLNFGVLHLQFKNFFGATRCTVCTCVFKVCIAMVATNFKEKNNPQFAIIYVGLRIKNFHLDFYFRFLFMIFKFKSASYGSIYSNPSVIALAASVSVTTRSLEINPIAVPSSSAPQFSPSY